MGSRPHFSIWPFSLTKLVEMDHLWEICPYLILILLSKLSRQNQRTHRLCILRKTRQCTKITLLLTAQIKYTHPINMTQWELVKQKLKWLNKMIVIFIFRSKRENTGRNKERRRGKRRTRKQNQEHEQENIICLGCVGAVVSNTTGWKHCWPFTPPWIKAKPLIFLSRTSQIYSQQKVEKQVCWLRTENEIVISLQGIVTPFTASTLTAFQLSEDYFIPVTALDTHLSVEGWHSNNFHIENPFVVIHPLHPRERNLQVEKEWERMWQRAELRLC